MVRRLAAGAAVVLGASALLIVSARRAARETDVPPPVAPRGELTVAYPEEPPSLNPYLAAGENNATRDLLRPVLPTLLEITPDLAYRPALAVDPPRASEGGTFRVRFRLDRRARWSDGTAITASDVRFTWEVMKDLSRPVADRSGYERLSDIKVIDAATLDLVFDRAYPSWQDLFSAGDFVLPRHALEGRDFATAFDAGPPVAGGPFEVEKITPGLEVVYRPNPRWWGSGPGLERVRVQFVPEIQTALLLLEQGEVDVVVSTTQAALSKRISAIGATRESSAFGSAWWELAFNHTRAGPSDSAFRRAVAFGFGRSGFVDAVIKEDGRSLDDLAPGMGAGASFTRFRHNPARARSLLAEGGRQRNDAGEFLFEGRTALAISAPAESEIAGLLERALHAGLKGVGVRTEIQNPRGANFVARTLVEGDYDLALWERRGTPSYFVGRHLHSRYVPPAGLNFYRVTSPGLDSAVEALERSPSMDRRLSDLMAAMAEEIPALPMFEAKAFLAFQPRVTGPEANATVDGPFWNLEDWRLER
jgi:peptide/nickel transport system substrate-binding protein